MHLYQLVSNSESLRHVEFKNINDPDSLLKTIKTNTYVKQWVLEFNWRALTDKVKRKLQKLILQKNDNSIFIQDNQTLLNVPQMTQLFEINPVSDFDSNLQNSLV